MFCENINLHTDRSIQRATNYCSPNNPSKQILSYNILPTEQSQRNPSNLYQNIRFNGQQYGQIENNAQQINQQTTLELMNQNTRRQLKILKAVERNKNMTAILTIVLAFSERVQALRQKICGYPAQSFSPVQFFNVLDLNEKGYVDIYDFKRFINNQKVQQKHIVALFKRINGEHAKDNTRLTYFGYLNLLKPYFNEQLAKQLLMRDTIISKKFKKQSLSTSQMISNQLLEPTQQAVLLLFQQLLLLHSICSCEHEQAKELLMNEYMLNVKQIKEIIGLAESWMPTREINSTRRINSQQSRITQNEIHKSFLSIIFEFIQNNSEFQVQFKDMKYLLSFLNCHQYSISNDKFFSTLFLPINCKKQLLGELQKRKQQILNQQTSNNYMNMYLTKENLMNRGNVNMLKQYLQQKPQNSKDQFNATYQNLGNSKPNFLEFVHPQSIRRTNEQYIDPYLLAKIAKEHPQLLINASKDMFNHNTKNDQKWQPNQFTQRELTDNSSVPQQNIKIKSPPQAIVRQGYENKQLRGQFFDQNKINSSKISQTPFLQQFMRQSNLSKNANKSQIKGKVKVNNVNDSNLRDSSQMSDSAFQVVDYGISPQSYEENNSYVIKNYASNNKSPIKKDTLDDRYNEVVSQYQYNPKQQLQKQPRNMGKHVKLQQSNNQLFKIDQNSSYSKNIGYANKINGSKLQNSTGNILNKFQNRILDNSNSGNYIDTVGMSQSNMMSNSNIYNHNSFGMNTGRGNILDDFIKK